MNKENLMYKYLCIDTHKILLRYIKKDSLSFTAIWMNLEEIILGQIQPIITVLYYSHMKPKKIDLMEEGRKIVAIGNKVI